MKILPVIVLALAALSPALTADSFNFSGKWTIQNAGRGGGAQTTLNLSQIGSTVTGTVIPPRIDSGTSAPVNTEIFGGKADGSSVSFYVWGEPMSQSRCRIKEPCRGTKSGLQSRACPRPWA